MGLNKHRLILKEYSERLDESEKKLVQYPTKNHSLLACLMAIENVENPKEYIVEQVEDDFMIDCCSAEFLIENYTEKTCPQLLSDINPF